VPVIIGSVRQLWRLTLLADLIGLGGLAIAVLGNFFPGLFSDNSSWPPFLSNLGIELIGTWISIRILERIFSERERYQAMRVKVLRNLRWWLQYIRRQAIRVEWMEARLGKQELDYLKHVFKTWRNYLKPDEVAGCEAIHQSFEIFLEAQQRCIRSLAEIDTKRDALLAHLSRIDDNLHQETSLEKNQVLAIRKIGRANNLVHDAFRLKDFNVSFAQPERGGDYLLGRLSLIFRDLREIATTLGLIKLETIEEYYSALEEFVDKKGKLAGLYFDIAKHIRKLEKNIREETSEE
jgi:hypothetical protein